MIAANGQRDLVEQRSSLASRPSAVAIIESR